MSNVTEGISTETEPPNDQQSHETTSPPEEESNVKAKVAELIRQYGPEAVKLAVKGALLSTMAVGGGKVATRLGTEVFGAMRFPEQVATVLQGSNPEQHLSDEGILPPIRLDRCIEASELSHPTLLRTIQAIDVPDPTGGSKLLYLDPDKFFPDSHVREVCVYGQSNDGEKGTGMHALVDFGDGQFVIMNSHGSTWQFNVDALRDEVENASGVNIQFRGGKLVVGDEIWFRVVLGRDDIGDNNLAILRVKHVGERRWVSRNGDVDIFLDPERFSAQLIPVSDWARNPYHYFAELILQAQESGLEVDVNLDDSDSAMVIRAIPTSEIDVFGPNGQGMAVLFKLKERYTVTAPDSSSLEELPSKLGIWSDELGRVYKTPDGSAASDFLIYEHMIKIDRLDDAGEPESQTVWLEEITGAQISKTSNLLNIGDYLMTLVKTNDTDAPWRLVVISLIPEESPRSIPLASQTQITDYLRQSGFDDLQVLHYIDIKPMSDGRSIEVEIGGYGPDNERPTASLTFHNIISLNGKRLQHFGLSFNAAP